MKAHSDSIHRAERPAGLQGRYARRKQSGMTLVELTVYMAMALALSAALLMMLQSHFTFMRMLSSMAFLRDDAPQMNTMLTGILGQADSYRIYGSAIDAKAATNAVNTGGTAVRLRFRNPNGTFSEGIVDFSVIAGEPQLGYYNFNGAWSASPDWLISQQPTAVDFDDTSGILLVTLTGPFGEQITYAGTGE
jgi:hypothetical protein